MYLFIHRRDLRTHDLPAFRYISEQKRAGIHLFVLDQQIIGSERHLEPSGRAFLQRLEALHAQYDYYGKTLHILQGDLAHLLKNLFTSHNIDELIYHCDFTPYAKKRDELMCDLANQHGIKVSSFIEHPLVEANQFQTFVGKPESYKIFTPFYKKWLEYLEYHVPFADQISIESLDTATLSPQFIQQYSPDSNVYPVKDSMRLTIANDAPRQRLSTFIETQVQHYKQSRDDYHYDSTSRLSLFLNTGALSAREIFETIRNERVIGTDPWLRQLAWRDFYLYQSVMNKNYYDYEKQYDFSALTDQYYERWANGETGIPIIDAAMRELNETGHMHNRLRMVTAMFLTKNLLCPFMLGEQHFRKKLLDYDNALNRGGWLWSTSLGYDGAPYFRVMNPVSQSQRFDPEGIYLRRWLPERKHLSQEQIHLPEDDAIVDLKTSRQQSIDVYKIILEKAK
jgi:deoxyribodipyrimidine photo-lyase